jgi:competence protein ComEC
VSLITGDRSGIPDAVRQQYADAGIAHILAISGLHLSIVAGVVFFFVRGGLCLVPAISLRYPTKKWAAIGVMAFTFIYLLICAAPVSAQRSFLMTWLILAGVLTDRIALTLRNVALAATAILLMFPECLMSPSFQLSFAAVIALVAGYEALREPMRRWQSKNTSTVRRFGLYLLGISISTILATLATTPYIVYTFHRFTLHAIPANLLSIPLTSFMIMPGLVLMLVLMPFGLDGFLHKNYAIQLMTLTAQNISSWPGSVMLIPSISATSLGLLTFGALMLTFLKTKFRLWGLLLITIGIGLAVIATPPDLYISGDGKAIGLRTTDGLLWTPRLRGGKFARESWMKMMAASSVERLPIYGEVSEGEIACNSPSYYLFDRYEILVGEKTVTVIDLDKKQPIIDSAFLQAHGGTLLWLQDDSPRMETVRNPNIQRPWSMR